MDTCFMAEDVCVAPVRRRRSVEEKRRIVAESFEPGASVAEVARRHGVNANLLFTWRRRHCGLAPAAATPCAEEPSLVPAIIVEAASLVSERQASKLSASAATAAVVGRMEIVVANGRRLIVDAEVDAAALGRVLDVLERR